MSPEAIEALKAQQAMSVGRGDRVWLNQRTLQPWATDAQVRKTAWLPLMQRSSIPY